VSAIAALAAAKAAGEELSLILGIIAQALKLPAEAVELQRAVKPELMRMPAAREAAWATLYAKPLPDCREDHWTEAIRGLHRFIVEGWGDRAALMSWSADELYRVPPSWRRSIRPAWPY
jgi:hypothetical protein